MRSAGIGLVIDGGANIGQYAAEIRREGYEGQIVSIEPLATPFAKLEQASAADPYWSCMRAALGEDAGVAEMKVTEPDASSSLLEPGAEMTSEYVSWSPGRVETVEVVRLDAVDWPVADALWLKLDLQGFELPALRGATGLFDRVRGLEVEVSFSALYRGQALAPEVMRFLADEGFRCHGIDGYLLDSAGEWLQAETLWFRPEN